jgi:hypothetical protein
MLKKKFLKRSSKKKSLKRSSKKKSLKRSLKRKSLKRSLKRKFDGVMDRYNNKIREIINYLSELNYKNTTNFDDILINIKNDETILFENENNVNLNIYFGKLFPFSNMMINRKKINPLGSIKNQINDIINDIIIEPKNWIQHLFPKKSDFNSFIKSKHSLNSYEILMEIFKLDSSIKDKDINILVGADNNWDSDYERFNNSKIYSIYISNGSYEPIRQYEMYTILYKDIILDNFPKNIISNIHFDMYVSYFVSGKEYFNIANHILKPGGKFIFEYGIQHSSTPLVFKDGKYCDYNGNDAKTFLKEQNFDFENSRFIINRKFYANNKLDPQKQVKTYLDFTDNKRKQFEYVEELSYLEYCRNEYKEFDIETKKFNLGDFREYPCPINSNDELFKFLTIEQKDKYIENKFISCDVWKDLSESTTDNLNATKKYIEATKK